MGLTRIRAQQISDIDYKQAVRVISTTNVTLTGGAPASVDGVSLLAGDRILVNGQSAGSENGLYRVQTVGTGSNGTWVRTTDANETGEIQAGMIVMVTEGGSYADSQWKLTTNDPIVVGTTALTFVINIMSVIGGSNTQIQFNNSGELAGSANLAWTGTILSIGANIIPQANITYDLGNSTNRWNDIWLANSTIYLGNAQISANATSLILTTPEGAQTALSGSTANISTSTVTATGNITGGNLITSGILSVTGNANVGNIGATNANLTSITATGNITGGNINTGARVVATGNVTGGNLTTAGRVDATGNVTGGNVTTAGVVAATGNVSGGNLTTAGIVSATGSLNTAGNLNFTNAEASDSAKIFANVSSTTTSLVLEVSDDNASDRIVLRHSYFLTGTTVDMLSAQRAGNTEANVTVTGNLIATNQVVATGNVTGGNLTTAGTATVATLTASTLVNATAATATTSTTTGAIRTAGGVGVGGNVHVGGALVAVTKSFAVTHPSKSQMILYHGCLEGPEHAVYVRGRCRDSIIRLPDYWPALIDQGSITVHLTPMAQTTLPAIRAIYSDRIELEGSYVIDCFYLIHATRRDVPGLEIEVPGTIQDLYGDH